jgi:hypothetical protein
MSTNPDNLSPDTTADLADVEKMREAVEARVAEEGQGDHAKPGVSYIEVSDRGRISINAALLARHLEEKFLVITDFGEEIGILPRMLISIGFSANYHGSRIC